MLKPEGVVFSGEQLNKLFPFFLHITGGGVIKAAGKSLRKIAGIETPLMFNDVFRIKRPFVEEFAAKHFDQITDQQTLQQAQHYFNDANYTHFAKSIHKLKNTLLMIGLDEWSSHLQFMESSALAETQLSMVKLFLDELMVTGQEVVEELEQVIPTV